MVVLELDAESLVRYSIKGLLEVQEDGVDLAAILQDERPVMDC